MVIRGIIVTNITQNSAKFRAQIEDFIQKSESINDFKLTEVKASEALRYLTDNSVDFCLFWDKDIYLAKQIESLGINVFNAPEAIYLCDDKALTAFALSKGKVNQPPYYVLPLHYFGNIIEYYDTYKSELLSLGLPIVIKERFGSFGEQVYLAKNEDELKTLINEHGTKGLLAQKYIRKDYGVDYRVNVIGEDVVLCVKRENKKDFRSNINQGGSAEIYEPSEKMKKLAIMATKAVGAHFAGVDVMIDEHEEPVVIEVNSNMRTIAFNKLSDVDLTRLILEYIKNAIKKHPTM